MCHRSKADPCGQHPLSCQYTNDLFSSSSLDIKHFLITCVVLHKLEIVCSVSMNYKTSLVSKTQWSIRSFSEFIRFDAIDLAPKLALHVRSYGTVCKVPAALQPYSPGAVHEDIMLEAEPEQMPLQSSGAVNKQSLVRPRVNTPWTHLFLLIFHQF